MIISHMFERNVQLYGCFIMQLNFIPDTFLEMVQMKQSNAKKAVGYYLSESTHGLFSFCARFSSPIAQKLIPILKVLFF